MQLVKKSLENIQNIYLGCWSLRPSWYRFLKHETGRMLQLVLERRSDGDITTASKKLSIHLWVLGGRDNVTDAIYYFILLGGVIALVCDKGFREDIDIQWGGEFPRACKSIEALMWNTAQCRPSVFDVLHVASLCTCTRDYFNVS